MHNPGHTKRPRRLYRRSATLVVWWTGRDAMGCDYALNVEHPVSPDALCILAKLSGWMSVGDLCRALRSARERHVRRTLQQLADWGAVERSDEPVHETRSALSSAWTAWKPSAAFFHFATKDGRRASLDEARRLIDRHLEDEEYPDVVKVDQQARRVALPPSARRGAFAEVLLARRSWRRFGLAPLSVAQLSTLLGLTWGVQRWMRIRPRIRSALKTSPSGGACHPLEVYVVARHVNGLPPGVYHYCPDAHDLEVVQEGLPAQPVTTYLGGQPWFADCAALFLITAVMPRVQWRYRFARQYRTLMIEAGHFGQTFCLVATWLGLAPFCTAMMADSTIEQTLGIDGIDEAAVYVTGVGTRPPGTAWAPWPSPSDTPATEPPSYSAGARWPPARG